MSSPPLARRHELDHLRVLAMLGIILLHTGAVVVVAWRGSHPDLLSKFNVGNLADAGGRFAVNCFFMASGALLLDPIRRFVLRPHLLRIALPTLTWIAIYAVANVLLVRQGYPGVGGVLKDPTSQSFGELVRGLLAGPAVFHLWFVYALFGIYLVVPLLRALTDRVEPDRRRLLLWFLALWSVAGLIPWWGPYFWGDRFPTIYRLPFEPLPTGYVGLFVLGFVLSHYRDRLRVPPAAWAAMAAVGLGWTFTGTWLAARGDEANIFASYGNFNPPVLLYSIGVFGFFATRQRGPGPIWPLVRRASDLSFRVYLVHILVLHLLRVLTELGPLTVERPTIGLPLTYVATVSISLGVAWLLDLIRPLRRWI